MTIDDVRKYFEDKGISQREVGRFIGVDARTIRRWFAEEYSAPKLFYLAIEADIFDVEQVPTGRVTNQLKLKRKNT